jgi:hypothetical protein
VRERATGAEIGAAGAGACGVRPGAACGRLRRVLRRRMTTGSHLSARHSRGEAERAAVGRWKLGRATGKAAGPRRVSGLGLREGWARRKRREGKKEPISYFTKDLTKLNSNTNLNSNK